MDINDLQPLEPEFNVDIDKYCGKKAKLAKPYIDEVDSKYGLDGKILPEGKTEKALVLKVETMPLDTIENSKGEKKDLVASAIFSIKKNKDGVIGWGKNEKKPSKLQKFLNKMGVAHPSELEGKEVRVQEGKGGFLSFPIE